MTTLTTIGFIITLCLTAFVSFGEFQDRRLGAVIRRELRRAFAGRLVGVQGRRAR
ncbi:MAG: hypothetical protein R3A51_05835 [Nannocystaceae bacterium]|nr:hypothetical protein [Myxococcales bacterium]